MACAHRLSVCRALTAHPAYVQCVQCARARVCRPVCLCRVQHLCSMHPSSPPFVHAFSALAPAFSCTANQLPKPRQLDPFPFQPQNAGNGTANSIGNNVSRRLDKMSCTQGGRGGKCR